MKLNEFVKKHSKRPVVFRTAKVPRGLPMSGIQRTCIHTLVNNKGISYDNMCKQSLGRMPRFNDLTAEEATLIIERGNYMHKKKNADRHMHTYGSESPQPTNATGGQKFHIQRLIQQAHVPYSVIVSEALGKIIDINTLTYKQAVAVIKTGKRMSGGQKKRIKRPEGKKISPFQQIDLDLLIDMHEVSYVTMCARALGRVVLRENLTFEQASRVIEMGKSIAGLPFSKPTPSLEGGKRG